MTDEQLEAMRVVSAGEFVPTMRREANGWHARWEPVAAVSPAVSRWVDEAVRQAARTALSADAENQQHETLHDAWLMALKSRTGLVRWNEEECAAFARELVRWAEPVVAGVAARAAIRFRHITEGRTCSRLECDIPSGVAAMRALGEAASLFGPLRLLKRNGAGRLALELTAAENESFLRTGARALRNAGYAVEGDAEPAAVEATCEIRDTETGQSPAKSLRPGESASLDVKIRVAGKIVTAEEIRFLLEQGSTIVFFRDKWIEVDRSLLREALRVLERARPGRLKRLEAVSFALGLGAVGRLQLSEARTHGWVRGLVESLRRAGNLPAGAIQSPPGFAGVLRDYQQRGAAWLKFLTGNGFGALLADDMGLGKTIQAIAWLLANNAQDRPAGGAKDGPALIVAPLSLVANWRHELSRFAPGLKVYVHHGEKRRLAGGFARAAGDADAVLTSYSLFVKDYSLVSGVKWGALILDEAQTIKNPDTQMARAACALQPPCRIALTGTPVENSVADLWSLERFLNPGFLPDRAEFAERFAKPLAADPHAEAGRRLRRALEPFVLRRLKSDPGVAAELGPKREIREFCELSARSRAAYDAELEDWRSSERSQGDIFALITRLKLVCDGLTGQNAADDLDDTGKLARLFDLLEGIFEAGESALVFTQYAKVGAILRNALEKRFKRNFPFLHGGRTPQQREQDIAAFNEPGPNALLLSLRAGGFGLNLTKATHVIHYDRWWNPAVEAQATDRAHRIGQSSTVFVHLFITAGTLEERIDALLERKLAAAGSLVAAGENFFASISRSELETCVFGGVEP